MPIQMTKEELQALLAKQVEAMASADPFQQMVKTTVEKMIKDLQKTTPDPFSEQGGKKLVSALPFAKIDGQYLHTKQGSIFNLNNKNTPWIQISDELKTWAIDFAAYIKSGSVSKLLSSAVDTQGGYLVPEEFRAVMLMYDAEETLVWSRATVWPMSGEKMMFPKLMQNPDVNDQSFDHFSGVSFGWVEEGGEKPATEPSFGLVEMIVHELAGYTEITNTLLDDAIINFINYLTKLFRAAWYWYTDKCFISGTGGKQPLGILSDPNIIGVNRQTASNVNAQDIFNMEAAMPAMFDSQAVWFITKKARANLRGQTVSISSKELVLQETYANISDGYQMNMLGRPAFLADGKIPALGSSGDIILAAWNWYYIGFRQDFSMDSSTHYKFRQNRTALRCSGRLDGQAAMPKAFVILNAATS
jgi:HK97 family phage major capsid protein